MVSARDVGAGYADLLEDERVKALLNAARAVNHTFYGMLLREWGVSENWPANAHGKVVHDQLRDILAQWEVSDG